MQKQYLAGIYLTLNNKFPYCFSYTGPAKAGSNCYYEQYTTNPPFLTGFIVENSQLVLEANCSIHCALTQHVSNEHATG